MTNSSPAERPVRVLHMLHAVTRGGVEQRRLNIARAGRARPVEHRVVCQHAGGPLPERLRDHGWRLYEIGSPRSILDVAWYRRARAVARDFRPDIIHGAVYEGIALANVVGAFLPAAKVISEETSEPANRRLTGHALMRLLLTRSDRVIGVSDNVTRYLRETLRVPPRKVRRIMNGVQDPGPAPPERVAEWRRAYGFDAETVVIGSVGRLRDEHKRFSDLLRAFAQVDVANARLLIVGDGDDRTMLEDLARTLGVADRVVFAGYQGDTRAFYELMDIFALASAHEAFGLVNVEAMFAGLPVVATRVGGIPEIVVDGETGWLVPPLAPDALADAIARLAADPDRRARMGAAGRERASLHFSAERYAREVYALYDEVLRERRR